ncbi:hypothetical protein D9619_008788 [Psilocybe cf. subviscida]|uniref:Uncharacterized protein n=1 Tax=Psilocybe cf. subviscida TaxID=2480587 RepID=A0A8H5B9J2_9AGAR|nr:hypothetical protein D9619_008788 [Psilocybe cf. subviscida]
MANTARNRYGFSHHSLTQAVGGYDQGEHEQDAGEKLGRQVFFRHSTHTHRRCGGFARENDQEMWQKVDLISMQTGDIIDHGSHLETRRPIPAKILSEPGLTFMCTTFFSARLLFDWLAQPLRAHRLSPTGRYQRAASDPLDRETTLALALSTVHAFKPVLGASMCFPRAGEKNIKVDGVVLWEAGWVYGDNSRATKQREEGLATRWVIDARQCAQSLIFNSSMTPRHLTRLLYPSCLPTLSYWKKADTS